MTEKQIEDDDRSYITLDLEMEKQMNILTDCDDDLNDAKLCLNNDLSISSEPFNIISTQHNMSTPINKIVPINPINEKYSHTNTNHGRNTNVNILSQQSFYSLFQNENPSACSSTNLKTPPKNSIIHPSYPNGFNKMSFDLQSNSVDLTNKDINFIHQSSQFNNFNCKNKINPISESFHSIQQPKLPIQRNFTNKLPFVPYSFFNDKTNWSKMSKIDMSYSSHSPYMKNDSSYYLDNLILMMKDQAGAKCIEKKIKEKASPEFLMQLYEKMKVCLVDIICHKFGNYVIQEYIKYCDKKIIIQMLHQLQPHLFEISIDSYGTRALQKIIEQSSIDNEENYKVIRQFVQGNVYNLINNINGNHVIQTIIQFANKTLLKPMYKELNERIIEITKLKEGGCVFPKILNNSLDEDRDMLIENILNHIDILINDDFGNFIIQHILKLNMKKFNSIIFCNIENKIIKLSTQKYSSTVIQACIDESCDIKHIIIDKLIEKNNVKALIMDKYGNYSKHICIINSLIVIQKGMQIATNNQFDIIIEQLRKTIKNLTQTNHGKRVYDNLLKNYGEYFQNKDTHVSNINNGHNNNNNYQHQHGKKMSKKK